MRVATTLLAAASAALAYAAAPEKLNAQPARFFLPEEPRNQHKLLLEAFETLGIERFVPPNSHDQNEAAQNPLYLWSFLPSASEHVDLVWSVAASPPFDQVRFPQTLRPVLNHLPGAEKLTSSDQLFQHIQRRQEIHGRFYFNFVPNHYVLPRDQAAMAQAFPDILKKVEYELKRERDWYIYQRFVVREQPASGDERARTPAQVIITQQQLGEQLAGPFAGKTVEVASYIEPYLLDGHKFSVGFYVAVTSLDPLRVYVFSHAGVKIAKVQYPADVNVLTDRGAYNFDAYHPPWDFPELQKDFHEFPSREREGSNAWAIVKRHMLSRGLDTRRLQREIDDAIVRVIASSRGHFQAEIAKLKRAEATNGSTPTDLGDKFFDLWKFEFEIDDMAKPWLVAVHSNPSLAPETSVFGTDEAIKRRLLLDLLAMVGVPPQAKQSFDQFFHPMTAAFCAQKCADKARVWDTTCWSCPGWFAPNVARRLFDATHEYARRGRFNLVFPDLEKDHSKFMDTPLTEHDVAFDRYLKSLSSGYAEKPSLSFDRSVVCVYREHCSDHGDCVNGVCKCDSQYEGTTCYIPKDTARVNADKTPKVAQREATGAHATSETWKEKVGHLWNRSPAPAVSADGGAGARQGTTTGANASEMAQFSWSKLGLGLLMLAAFLLAAVRVFSAYAPTSHDRKSN